MLIYTRKKSRLLKHFQKDPVLFAYHIGDLDNFYFDDCQFAADYGDSHVPGEVVMIYTGLAVPNVMAFGLTANFEALLNEILPTLPEQFYCHFFAEYREAIKQQFAEKPLGTYLKMKLVDPDQSVLAMQSDNVRKLTAQDSEQLLSMYEKDYPDHYFIPRMLETGKYFGYLDKGQIVSVAGVHVDSDEYRLAVLGNIVTSNSHRGRGYAGIVTACLVRALVEEGKLVCLNVNQDNHPAIRCYERIGFRKHCEYEESLFELKQAVDHSIPIGHERQDSVSLGSGNHQ